MIALGFLLALAGTPQAQSIAGWGVVCESAREADDGLFDVCYLSKTLEGGARVVIVRTYAGAEFTATITGCKLKSSVDPIVRTRADLEGEGREKLFVGGVIGAVIANNRQCPKLPLVIAVGGEAEALELLAATAKLRPPTP